MTHSTGASPGNQDPASPGPPPGYPQNPYPQNPYPPAQYPSAQNPQGQYPVPRAQPNGFVERWWLLFTIPLGFTTWTAFLYIGIRAKRVRWMIWSAVYVIGLVAFMVLSTNSDTGAREGLAVCAILLTWIGGGIHALAISGDAVKRIYGGPSDPLLEAGKNRIARRAEGRRLLANQPALAKEVGLGRPDLHGSDDYGLVDVNHCAEAGLALLPGMTPALAKQIVDYRGQYGQFSSVEDLGEMLNLSPGQIDNMRDLAIFVRD